MIDIRLGYSCLRLKLSMDMLSTNENDTTRIYDVASLWFQE